ncbi:unnamed protein product [Calypogeia fissa]
MAWVLDVLKSVQDAINPLAAAPLASPELVLPKVTQLNDSVYELCNPSGTRSGRPSVEIVFFHGLQFDGSDTTYLTTWLSKDGQESWLPWIFKYVPEARILLVSYDGYTKKEDEKGCTDMYITSENLVQDLIDDNAQIGQDGCPVVLVGHSLGGLVIKEVLLKASSMLMLDPAESVEENLVFFLENVKQLFYYSCPHNGTRLVDIRTEYAKAPLFEHLKVFNKEAARCNNAFSRLRYKFKWVAHAVSEALPTDLGHLGTFILVPEASSRSDSDTYYTVATNHFNVCRPKSIFDRKFLNLKDVLCQAVAADVNGHKVSVSKAVGLDKQVAEVGRKLKKFRQLGLFGVSGIGKSTLAKLVYNEMSSSFEYTSFVSEVKEVVRETARLADLKAEILRNLFYKGRQVLVKWSRLKGKRVLIVLDDVKYESQILDLTEANGFSTESCVLLTCRDRGILRLKDFAVYSVQFLDDKASKELFCNHAFKHANAPEAYKDRVKIFTRKCGGWPLVLEVAGKYLYKQKEGAVWDDAFKKLCQAKPLNGRKDEDKLRPIFKLVYESLETEERQMFLDVAICFHDEELKSVKEAWRVCKFSANSGWVNLLDLGLVTTITTKSSRSSFSRKLLYSDVIIITKIQMHEVLRDLGWSLACPETRRIQGHSSVHLNTSPWPFDKRNSEVKILKIVGNGGQHDPRDEQLSTINIGKFCGLENLKALWLDAVHLRVDCNLFPENLEFLKVRSVLSSELPLSIPYISDVLCTVLKNMEVWLSPFLTGVKVYLIGFMVIFVVLLGVECLIRTLGIAPQGFGMFWFLFVILRLFEERCYWPSWFRVNDIEAFVAICYLWVFKFQFLLGCTHLLPVSETIHRKAKGWYSVMRVAFRRRTYRAVRRLEIESSEIALSDLVPDLQALEHLEVRSSTVRRLDDNLDQLLALKRLSIEGFWLSRTSNPNSRSAEVFWFVSTRIPDSIGQLSALESLTFRHCYFSRDLPSTLGQLKALRRLEVLWCQNLTALPETIGQLVGLRQLRISGCSDLGSLPDAIWELQALEHLEITDCPNLRVLPPRLADLRMLRHFEIELRGNDLKFLQDREVENESLIRLQDILRKLDQPLQHLSVFSPLPSSTVAEYLGQLDSVKHLKKWTGIGRDGRVGDELRSQGGYFQIIFCWEFTAPTLALTTV